MFCRETILRLMNMSVCLQTAMFIELRTFLLIHMSIVLLLQDYLLGLQSQKFSDAALRLIASKPPLKMWVVKKN